MKLSILGEGAWGTAVATLLAANGHQVYLWCYNADVKKEIEETRYNTRFLPGVHLSENIVPVTSMRESVCDSAWIFEAIPVKFLRGVLESARECFSQDQTWVVLSKGIEQDTCLLPSQIIADVYSPDVNIAVFTGPSYAHNVAAQEITAVTIAAKDCHIGTQLQKLLANDYFRPYVTLDVIGVQVGGALKNVIALLVGMLDGAGYGDNAKAFIFTRGLHEMVQVAKAIGGKKETLYGLSGVGDLVLTAMGSQSRNVQVGRKLGQGMSIDELEQAGITAEGLNTINSVNQLLGDYGLDLPIFNGVYQVVSGKTNLSEFLATLMSRPLIPECD